MQLSLITTDPTPAPALIAARIELERCPSELLAAKVEALEEQARKEAR